MKIDEIASDMNAGESREVFNATEVKRSPIVGECPVCGSATHYVDTYHKSYVCTDNCIHKLIHDDWYEAIGKNVKGK